MLLLPTSPCLAISSSPSQSSAAAAYSLISFEAELPSWCILNWVSFNVFWTKKVIILFNLMYGCIKAMAIKLDFSIANGRAAENAGQNDDGISAVIVSVGVRRHETQCPRLEFALDGPRPLKAALKSSLVDRGITALIDVIIKTSYLMLSTLNGEL